MRYMQVVIMVSVFSTSALHAYTKEEVEIGNSVQHEYQVWKKNFGTEPDFINKENLMRKAGCNVSYHRCMYKNQYFTFNELIKKRYPKVDISKIQRPRYTKSRYKRKIEVQTMPTGPIIIKQNYGTYNPYQKIKQTSAFPVKRGRGAAGAWKWKDISDPRKCVPNIHTGTKIPVLPDSGPCKAKAKPLPKL